MDGIFGSCSLRKKKDFLVSWFNRASIYLPLHPQRAPIPSTAPSKKIIYAWILYAQLGTEPGTSRGGIVRSNYYTNCTTSCYKFYHCFGVRGAR